MKRPVLAIATLLVSVVIGSFVIELASSQRDYFIERKGLLSTAETVAESDAAGHSQTRRLVSTSGLETSMRVLRPRMVTTGKLPVLLLLGGHQTGKDAVALVGRPAGVAFAAIDYPYTGSRSVDGVWQSLRAVPSIQKAFIDTPPALSLAVDWLLQQPWVDPERIELVGVSLGVPFAAAAAGVDARFSRVWLLHGGADNQNWVDHAGRNAIPNDTLRSGVARIALFLVYGNSFDTRAWIDEIAPRPIVVVAARDDDYVPPAAQAPFVEAAENGQVELIWTEGLHIRPQRGEELGQLLDIVLSRIARVE